MSSKDRLWERLPPFIWGEGSEGRVSEGDVYTDTLHLTHTRFPRFVCAYDDTEDEYFDEPETHGKGAKLFVLAGRYVFSSFVFIDPPPNMIALAEVCMVAALCREELDGLDGPGLADAVGMADDEDEDEDDVRFDPAAIRAAFPTFFPAGWEREWQIKRDQARVVLVHRQGYAAHIDDNSEVQITGLLPGDRSRRRAEAQALRLLNGEDCDALVATAVHWENKVERLLRKTLDQLCDDCRMVYDEGMRHFFPPGWRAHWVVAADGLSVQRDDDYVLRAQTATGHGVLVTPDCEVMLEYKGQPLPAGTAPGPDDGRASVQGSSLLLQQSPEELMLRRTPHHQPADVAPMLAEADVVDMLVEMFPADWKQDWRLAPDGRSATHVSGVTAQRNDGSALKVELTPGNVRSPHEACAVIVQSHALLFDLPPQEAAAVCVKLVQAYVPGCFDGTE